MRREGDDDDDQGAEPGVAQEWPWEDKVARDVALAGRIDGRGRYGLGKGSLEKARAGEAFPGSRRLSCAERGQYTLWLGLLSTPTLGQDALRGRFLENLKDDGHQLNQDARQHASRQPHGLGLLERLLECLRVLLSTGNALKRLLNLLEALLTGLRLLAALLSLWHDFLLSPRSLPYHAGTTPAYLHSILVR